MGSGDETGQPEPETLHRKEIKEDSHATPNTNNLTTREVIDESERQFPQEKDSQTKDKEQKQNEVERLYAQRYSLSADKNDSEAGYSNTSEDLNLNVQMSSLERNLQ